MEKIEELVENIAHDTETQSSSSSGHSSDSVIVCGQYKKESLSQINESVDRKKKIKLIRNVGISSEVVEEKGDNVIEISTSHTREVVVSRKNTPTSSKKKSKMKTKDSKTMSTSSSMSEILERSEEEVLEAGTSNSSDSIAESSKQSKHSSYTLSKGNTNNSRAKSRTASLSGVLEGLEDDLLEVGTPFSLDDVSDHFSSIVEGSISEQVFVQNRKGFEPISADKLFKGEHHDPHANGELNTKKKHNNSHEFAIFLYNCCRQFSILCHGVLAGFGMCHASLVLTVADNSQAIQGFVDSYPTFARMVQVMYYFLTAVCVVSVLDRCDVGGLTIQNCEFFFNCRITHVVTIICYSTLLVITVIAIQWDDKFALNPYNEDLWGSHESIGEFSRWRIVSVFRGLLALIGYVFMCFGPGDDLFYEDLTKTISYSEPVQSSQDLLKC